MDRESEEIGQPTTPDDDRVRRIIDHSVRRTTIHDLQRRGLRDVRVVNERKIHELIAEAIDGAIRERSAAHLEEERERLSKESMDEFQVMMREHQDSVKMQQRLRATKERLDAEYDRIASGLREQLGDDGAAVGDLGSLKGQLDALLGLVQELSLIHI